MVRPLRSLGVAIAAVISLAAIAELAVGQDRGADAGNGAGAGSGAGPGGVPGTAARRGARGGGGLAGTGADLGTGTPAATLARPTTPSKAPDPAGFIQRWMVLEPIPTSGLTDSAVRGAVSKEYFPGKLTALPHDGDKVSVNGQELAWHAEDTSRYNLNLFHFARA